MSRRNLARLLRDRAGVAAVEATLVISLVMVPLSLGVIDFGIAFSDMARLDRALHAATLYVWNNPSSFTTSGATSAGGSGIQTAANNAYGTTASGTTSPTLTVSYTTACSCVSSGYSKVASVSCSGSCSSGQTVAAYLTITASATFTLPVTVPYFSTSLSQSVSGTIRTQ